ncbi:MmcQ/YjbR family DNA-binding protein [Arthrobacter sp. ISL-85]|uniref:MmcQ/YjbR family DNA-binding protein n=1 Tax=Arthrobacter sp. ISL-85 TaxID=2819115 RepID=UPI001BEA4FD4|nr:MmcQ/YjbR family DNA-binding protein [Arthrobacter sp. ISL-85]MBT2566361.1 MmcQ/YjbR family DNA-binding protein [Arthrobacter sp. ISL-85]
MDGKELQATADEHASGLPEVTVEHRVGPNWDTYKVSGKVFMLMTDMPGHPVVVVKADPEEAVLLRAQYEEISTGYHMDKKHWITAAGGPGIDRDLVKGLITDSYQLVVEKLPRSERPNKWADETSA